MGNDRSEWLVDWLIEMTDSLNLDLNPAKVEIPDHLVNRSDHGPFMREGYPAMSCWENIEGDSSEFNPHYHTVADTVGNVSIPLTATIASMFAGSLALLADGGAVRDFKVPENGVIVRPDRVSVGDSITVLAAVWNLGVATDGPVAFTVSVMEGPVGGGVRQVSSHPVMLDLPRGTWKYVTVPWVPDEETIGMREVRVRVVPDSPGLDSDPDNNEGMRAVVVAAPKTVVFDVYAYPNPVKLNEHRLDDLVFHYQLSHGMDVRIKVFSLEGREIASFFRRYDDFAEEQGTVSGPNRVRWDWLEGRPGSLAPGLYFFSVKVWDEGFEGPVFGKFAVIR